MLERGRWLRSMPSGDDASFGRCDHYDGRQTVDDRCESGPVVQLLSAGRPLNKLGVALVQNVGSAAAPDGDVVRRSGLSGQLDALNGRMGASSALAVYLTIVVRLS